MSYPIFQPSQLLASSAVTVDLDPTVFMHFVLFTAFIWFMKDLIFDPLLKVFEERLRLTKGAIEKAREMDEESIELQQEYDSKIEDVRREAAIDRERIRDNIKRVESGLMGEAREAVSKTLDAGMAQIQGEVEEIKRDLDAEQGTLAADIASKVLGRKVAARRAAP